MAGLQIGQQVGGRMFDMMSQRIFGNDSTQSLSKENFWQVSWLLCRKKA